MKFMKRATTMKIYDAIIVGGGAAGCVAAGYAAQNGKKILILERNKRPARKILVTGKGRCNVTNNCEPEEFFRHVRSNPRFLYSALSRFSPKHTMELFENLGVPLKTERGRRVFPVSDRALDIADALQVFIKNKNIEVVQGRAKNLVFEDGVLKGVLTEEGEFFRAQKVVISTGGLSYSATGSSGDGYKLAAQAGHKIIPTRASLVGIHTAENLSDASGLSLKNVTLRLYDAKKKKPIYEELGEMLITHDGISGPLVLSASSFMSTEPESYRIELDLKPGLSTEELDARILRDFSEKKNRDFINSLDELLPRSFIPYVVERSKIAPETKVHQITKAQRLELVSAIKSFGIKPVALGDIEGAVITAGGVSVKEVDPKTMESKLIPGLYFAGEVLDLDAETGGYNLQIAFATGYAAGMAI
ncbi:MAG: NAD(P)/FAD-dependent oxidoreductase [Oscillospiraceae bacterium]|nr:NAD(P)/FAD-dependent oxidoreductase [Oscillospiraceae bacterium]